MRLPKCFLFLSFAVVALSAGNGFGAADNAPPGVADEPTGKVKPDVTTGDPVSVSTGAVAFECADVLVRCPGVDLAFRRYYNSRFPHAEGLTLGEGWRDSWDLRLVCLTRGVTVTGESGPVTVTPGGAAVTNRPVHAEVALSRSVLLYLPDGDVAEFSGRNLSGGYAVSETAQYRVATNAVAFVAPGEARVPDFGTRVSREYWSDRSPLAGTVWGGDGTAYAFGADGRLASVTAPGGETVTLARAPDGFPLSAAHSNGLSLEFSRDAAGMLSSVAAPGGALRAEYRYSAGNVLTNATRFTSSGAAPDSYLYLDGTSLLTNRVNAAGRGFNYEYARVTLNGAGVWACVRTWMGGGWHRSELSFAPDRPRSDILESVSGSDARAARYTWDRRDFVRTVSVARRPGDFTAPSAEYVRDAAGTVLSATRWSSSGDWVSYAASTDAWHNVTGAAAGFNGSAAHNVFSAGYHPRFAVPLWSADADGVTNSVGVSDSGLPVSFTDALGGAVSVGYSGSEVAEVSDPCGRRVELGFDSLGRVSGVAAPLLPPVSVSNDLYGIARSVTMPGPGGSTREWRIGSDEIGRNPAVAGPDGLETRLWHDPCGNPTSAVSRAGRRVDVSWLPAAHPGSVTRWVDGETPATVTYGYDLLFRTMAVTDPLGREVERYALDDEDRAVAATNLEGQAFSAAYAAGGAVRFLRRYDGSTVTNAFDHLGRVTRTVTRSADGAAAEAASFAYTAAGRLTNAVNAAASLSFGYDAAERNVSERSASAVAWELVSALDASGIPTNTALSASGVAVFSESVTLDAAARISSVSLPNGGSVAFGYCGWNGLECAQTNAAFTVSKEYDLLNRVTSVTYAAGGGAPLYRFEYAHDPDGLVTQRVVTTASGAVTNSYAYDGLMRLVSESGPGGGTAYAYDLCGNRLSVTAQGGTTSVTYTHNRRDADTCDAAGNVTQTVNAKGQTLDLTWNLQRQLVSVSTNGVFAESYAYDPLGRRASTTDAGGTVYHAYDGIHCVADLSQDGNLLRSYTWGAGIDNLLAVTLYDGDSTNTLYAVTDPLGTVHALVASDGTIAVSYTYDSWGNLLSATGDESLITTLRFTWQGREYSHATGLYNFRARWYDPAAGRWLSKDPIGLEGGLNLYEAFGNNPVNMIDPLGLRSSVSVIIPGAGLHDLGYFSDEPTDIIHGGIHDLSDEELMNEAHRIYHDIVKINPLKINDLWREFDFDTYFWDGIFSERIFIYNGKRFRGNEVNYIGIGMFEAHLGRNPKWAIYLWKGYHYFQCPTPGVLFWAEKGSLLYKQFKLGPQL